MDNNSGGSGGVSGVGYDRMSQIQESEQEWDEDLSQTEENFRGKGHRILTNSKVQIRQSKKAIFLNQGGNMTRLSSLRNSPRGITGENSSRMLISKTNTLLEGGPDNTKDEDNMESA